jgi:Arc/MetJ-type ribon-helix-helix transcriptional regulator
MLGQRGKPGWSRRYQATSKYLRRALRDLTRRELVRAAREDMLRNLSRLLTGNREAEQRFPRP